MTYDAFLQNLNARGVSRIRPELSRLSSVLKLLGNPQDKIPTVHIAGTNGKGSVAAALESVLRASGYKTGFYSSPHLIDLQERVQVDGAPSQKAFLAAADRVLSLERKAHVRLTYFELMTAIAFSVFAKERVDITILECGMGGQWDATNVISRPLLSIITSVGLDHQNYLGRTLSKIAEQKAGIIKSGRPVISGVLSAGRQVIRNQARAQKARLIQINKDFFVSSLPVISHIPFQTIRYRRKSGTPEAIPFALLGRHQSQNAGVVLAAIDELQAQGWAIPAQARVSGMKNVFWAGRFQVIDRPQSSTILLDGAHNPQAMTAFLQTLQASNLRHMLKTFIFSSFKDKDYRDMARQISKVADEVCLFPLEGPRAASVTQLRAAFKAVDGPVRSFSSYDEAWNAAIRDTPKDDLIVITGSLMLIGQALHKLHMRPHLRHSYV